MSEHNITLDGGSSVRLKTAGKYCDRDIIVTATSDIDSLSEGTITEITSNLTTLREYAFAKCTQLRTASLPFVTEVSSHVFNGCTSLKTVELSNAVTRIAYNTFYNCSNLELSALPSSLKTINSNAFSGCKKITITELPSSLTTIESSAFNGCTGLTSITFKVKPTNTLATNVFGGCTNLLTINVPWAEGEVANAPWGATNATINYNYVG